MSPLFQNRNDPFRRLVRAPLGSFACRAYCQLYAAAPRSCFNSRGALFSPCRVVFKPAPLQRFTRFAWIFLRAWPKCSAGAASSAAVHLPQKTPLCTLGWTQPECTGASFFHPFKLKQPLTARIPHRKKQGSDKICTAPARRPPGRTERPLCTAQAAPAAPKDVL